MPRRRLVPNGPTLDNTREGKRAYGSYDGHNAKSGANRRAGARTNRQKRRRWRRDLKASRW